MEDSHIAVLDLGGGVSFFGVYDGHGGNEVAEWVRDNLIDELKQLSSFKAGNYEQALKDIYLRVDQLLTTQPVKDNLLKYKKQDSGNTMFGRP